MKKFFFPSPPLSVPPPGTFTTSYVRVPVAAGSVVHISTVEGMTTSIVHGTAEMTSTLPPQGNPTPTIRTLLIK